jgi:Flp pilus assembly protein TadD
MKTFKKIPARSNSVVAVLTCGAMLVAAGCATTDTTRNKSRIQIQEQVGFTITEDANVSENTRVNYGQALLLLEQGQSSEGIAMLEQVADATPSLSAPRIDLGIAFAGIGDLESAEKHLLTALASNPEHPIAHNELGIVYRKLGRFAEAREHYEAALAIYPELHFARRNLAVLCDLYLADLKCALRNYEAYMAVAPDDQEAQMWVADIRNRVGN